MSLEQLREKGTKTPIRPERPVPDVKLTYVVPLLDTSPRSPVDALLILGIHPIEPVVAGPDGNRQVIMTHPMMRNNARASLCLVDKGYVRQGGLVIPSGNSSAYPEAIEAARRVREDIFTNGRDIGPAWMNTFSNLPASDDEATLVSHTTEASLLANFLAIYGRQILINRNLTVVPDHTATENVFNIIHALNELDRRSVAETGEIFTGSIGIVTTRNHTVRIMQATGLFGIANQVVPLASQEVLKHFGETPAEIENDTLWSDKTLWREQKWIRALYQIPSYFLPVLTSIENDERLITTLEQVRKQYPEEAFTQFGLDDLSVENAPRLRSALASITRCDPKEEEWMRTDTETITRARDAHAEFTQDWLDSNPSLNSPVDPRSLRSRRDLAQASH
jgi:hypothetical protein